MGESNLSLLPQKRIEFVDLLKVFSTFCLLWFHSIGDLRTSNDEWFFATDRLHTFFIIFNMPLFFLISGFFFSSSLTLSFKDFLRKRSSALLIPHLTWGIVIALLLWGSPYIGMAWRAEEQIPPFNIFTYIYELLAPDPAIYFWFLKELFLTSLIVFTAYKISKKGILAFIVSMVFVLVVNFFGVVGKLQRFLMPVFWAGILLKAYYPIFSKHLNKFLIGSGILFVVCFYFFDDAYAIYTMDFPPIINFQQSLAEGRIFFDFTNGIEWSISVNEPLISGRIIFDFTDIDISVFRSFAGIVGSIFFFALFQRCWKKNAVTAFFSRCGRLTVGIYGVQAIILQYLLSNLLDFMSVNIWMYRFFVTPIVAAVVLLICIGVVRLIQRNRPLTFILFGSSLVAARGVIRYENQPQSDDRVQSV
jgi:fucose 4-O-acetylase-like acetyltransferase